MMKIEMLLYHPNLLKILLFNEDTCRWEHPIPHPDDHGIYHWNEETVSWDSGFN